MKTRALASLLILVLAVLIIVVSCATGKKAPVVKEDEVLCGTWINTDYDTMWKYGKIIIEPEGYYYEYDPSYSDSWIFKGDYTIIQKWTDADGNTYYKYMVTTIHEVVPQVGDKWYYLASIDKSGDIFEYVDSAVEFPSEINPNYYTYTIRYRQE